MASIKKKVEPNFGLDDFGKAKYLNETEALANAILNLLFGKPGYFPSMPKLGINIQSILYSFWDEVNVDQLKAEIVTQCQSFSQYIKTGELDVIKTYNNSQPLLLIEKKKKILDGKQNLSVGITQDKNGNIAYNYVYI